MIFIFRWFNYQQPDRRLFTNSVTHLIVIFVVIIVTISICSGIIIIYLVVMVIITIVAIFIFSGIFIIIIYLVVMVIITIVTIFIPCSVVVWGASEFGLPLSPMDNRPCHALRPLPAPPLKVLLQSSNEDFHVFQCGYILIFSIWRICISLLCFHAPLSALLLQGDPRAQVNFILSSSLPR